MKRGRRGGTSESRQGIVRAARALFAKQGFKGTSMRAIAARARVDPALVHYFFSTKEQLLRAAIDIPDDRSAPLLESGGPALAHYYLAGLFPHRRDAITALLRAVVGDPGSVPALRRALEKAVVSPAAQALGGKDARLRAELVGSLVVGLFICRELMGMKPLATVPLAALTKRTGAALDALLR